MMKLAMCLAAAALAGCSSMGSWSPRSWTAPGPLQEAIGRPAPSAQPDRRLVMSDEQAGLLAQQAAQLRSESDAVWARLAAERDRSQRFRYYDQLRVLNERLAPIERDLRNAGRPSRAAGQPVPGA